MRYTNKCLGLLYFSLLCGCEHNTFRAMRLSRYRRLNTVTQCDTSCPTASSAVTPAATGCHTCFYTMSHLLLQGITPAATRCHTCCYNMPLATVIFTVMFCLSVTVVPVIEQRLIQLQTGPASRLHHHTGLEFIHGIVAWLFILAVYLIATQLAKAKVALRTSHILSHVSMLTRDIDIACLSDTFRYFIETAKHIVIVSLHLANDTR